jgi:hypothetical protein
VQVEERTEKYHYIFFMGSIGVNSHQLNNFVFLSCSAPVLVAIALIEMGMKYEDAVDLIRQ